LFELEQPASKTCLDILNFDAERLRPEIDEHVVYTWTSNVGYPHLGIPNPRTVDGIVLYRPTVLCSAGRTYRAGDL
jgi:hypothetical protein